MAAKVKGLTLEIDGNTVGLEKGLAKLNKPINAIKNELKDVTRLLKLDPGNTELLAQKQQLLSKQIAESKDFINGFAKGIANAASAVVDNVRGLADDICSLLHFSRPDEGPLRDYEKWPVDFIHGYADAMRSAMPYLQKTLDGITAGMAIMVNGPQLAGAGAAPVPTTKTINYNQTINVTSPDPVSPAETARATRIATRDLISKIKG